MCMNASQIAICLWRLSRMCMNTTYECCVWRLSRMCMNTTYIGFCFWPLGRMCMNTTCVRMFVLAAEPHVHEHHIYWNVLFGGLAACALTPHISECSFWRLGRVCMNTTYTEVFVLAAWPHVLVSHSSKTNSYTYRKAALVNCCYQYWPSRTAGHPLRFK